MFIFLDSNHPNPNPTKIYKNPKAPRKPPNQKHPTKTKNFRNTLHLERPYGIQDITYILQPFHISP
jgi:hypothetical protein